MRLDGWRTHPKRWMAMAAALVVVWIAVRSCASGAETSRQTLTRAQVTRRDLVVTKTATGEVRPQNRVEIKPPIAGRVDQVLVREGDQVATGAVLAWISSTDRAALLDAARAQGGDAMARWESAYKPAPLTAPLDGTIIVRAVEPGQTVTTADPVVVIADRLIVKAQVDETDIGAIRVDQPARISLDAYPSDEIAARIDHVAYEATTVNNVTIYEVDVLPEAVPDFMRSGMTATVTIVVESADGALAVPAEAVQKADGASTVMVPGTMLRGSSSVPVTTGVTDGKWIQIVSGLEEGQRILVPSLRLPQSFRARTSPLGPPRSRRNGGQTDRRSP